MGAEKSTPELVKEFKDSRRKKMNQHYYNPFEGRLQENPVQPLRR